MASSTANRSITLSSTTSLAKEENLLESPSKDETILIEKIAEQTFQSPVIIEASRPKYTVCSVVIFNDGLGRVLLQKRKNTSQMNNEYAFIGGAVEYGETPEEAAIREVQEEVGVTIEPSYLKFKHVMHTKYPTGTTLTALFFEIKAWHGIPRIMEPDKAADLGWYSSDDLPEDVSAYVPALLERIKNGVCYSTFGLIAE